MTFYNSMVPGMQTVSSAGSAKGLVDGVTGRVVPDGDAEALARAILELLADAAQRARLGAAARGAVESPEAWARVFDRLEAIYRHVRPDVSRGLVPVPLPQ